jgi:hypothetical protein
VAIRRGTFGIFRTRLGTVDTVVTNSTRPIRVPFAVPGFTTWST